MAEYCPKCGGAAESRTAFANAATLDSPSATRKNFLDTPALDQGRFVPGQILAERYRIVALLGKGGMGEVYRADDLRLGQQVAMKFLPESLSQDGAALARFHREVRLARQVSHSNVCRIFDIGETAGVPFLTMEYVGGEDLASLLKRIGRLPQDKAVDISRQLCAGLAAAHEAGVLHCDLKPANVMLDTRGKVRITDFGLAGLATAGGGDIGAGTPAYMAPEQLEGKPATIQSDIFSLGLVLYEVFTGKRAFAAPTLPELKKQHKSTTPTKPSQFVEGLDPLVERVILRCLEDEPNQRPHSALLVAAALPGGDPLAAALAAGETPSPEMVAAAGGEGVLSPTIAWSLLLAALFVMGAIVGFAPYSTDLGVAPARKSLGALEERAEEIIEKAGYRDAPADRASWFERNYDFLFYKAKHFSTAVARKELAHAELSALNFTYRQSPVAMAPTSVDSRVSALDPPQEISGMVTVVLDGNGRFIGLWAVPPQVSTAEQKASAAREPNWSEMLADTGLDPASLTPAESTWLPPSGFDRRYGWHGHYPEDPSTEIQISASSYQGKPVYFHVIGPWSGPWRMQADRRVESRVVRDTTLVIGGFVFLIVAALFARRNLKLGRGDRRGAFRIAAFIFCISGIAGLLTAHQVSNLGAEWQMFIRVVGQALFSAGFLWLYYMALEPFVRRQWPELLISWSRLLAGGIRDPLIGRDLLAGILFGGVIALGTHVSNALPTWFNLPGQTTISGSMLTLGPPQDVVGFLLSNLPGVMFGVFSVTFALFLARRLLRNYWLSVVAAGIIVLVTNLGGENFALEAPFSLLTTVVSMFVLLRLGIFASAVTGFTIGLLTNYPISFDFSKWYAPHSLFMFAVLVGMLIYGLRVATGNKALLGDG